MGLKPDHWIRKMANEQRMIEPFIDKQVRQGVISYGVSSYGYDVQPQSAPPQQWGGFGDFDDDIPF